MSLRIARKIARLSQQELALKAGIDNSTLSRYESGSRSLRTADYDTVISLARALNLEPEELFMIAALTDPASAPAKPTGGRT